MKTCRSKRVSGFSLLELLAVVTILGIIAAIIVPRVTVSTSTAKEKVRDHQMATINAAIERFYIDTGDFPTPTEFTGTGFGQNVSYFPDSIPVNPVTTSAYSYNTTTHRVAP